VDILYFAWVRERIGTDRERIEPPADIRNVRGLIGWLAGRSAGHAAALGDATRLRAAVNQQFVGLDAPVEGAREVAIFPPVTGG
jgi:molybdopterin synthase sulfur carrier subunit